MVYPRACGGTESGHIEKSVGPGLSPRVRGNRNIRALAHDIDGSIPARAGEPRYSDIVLGHERVYPRACGGTITSDPEFGINSGLSPRVRGNLINKLACDLAIGSIPARAGEPQARCQHDWNLGVYPRACGGTL